FYVNPNYKTVNAEAEDKDPDSILNFYRRALRLRKSERVLLDGEYKEYRPLSGRLYMYERRLGQEAALVICSFSKKPVSLRLPRPFDGKTGQLALCNYPGPAPEKILRPYEARVMIWREEENA
ncbi:MAG: glucohydrolase, partial [Oscillospiraceae bacterium]|nr:glucohydrolase [Oscillospiraceae bacterium]